ncbi:MAG: hypothetical protein EPO65_13105 [Dehalococcoidia bacterium]|nr:MAG: hypothetical protein EPO65_13105 [Dehalococcoidia bacterium]
MSRPTRGSHVALLIGLVLAATIAGCGGGGGDQWDSKSVEQTVASAPFQPILVNSNLGVGKNRIALALFDQNQELINSAEVKATFYHLDKEPKGEPKNPKRVSEATLVARTLKGVGAARIDGTAMASRVAAAPAAAAVDGHIGHDSTVFAALVDFDRDGFWGVSLDIKTGDKSYSGMRVVFAVQDRTLEPRVGDPAPATKQLTMADVKSVEEIDTSPTPNPELHRITIAQAVASGKPSVIAFVTPAFCQTRFCGPTLDQVVVPAFNEFKGRVNVLHVEPYDIAKAKGGKLELVPAVEDWKLLAEPIIFIVNKNGIVTAKFEGIMDYAEVRDAITQALSQ